MAACADAGVLFVVVHVEIDYRSPARYNDVLQIQTRITDSTRTSLTFAHTIRQRETDYLVVEGWARLVCVDERGKPRRLPDEVARVVTKLA
jgi:acyl-CoA thioester hydrolase